MNGSANIKALIKEMLGLGDSVHVPVQEYLCFCKSVHTWNIALQFSFGHKYPENKIKETRHNHTTISSSAETNSSLTLHNSLFQTSL